jgi:hypothetical protein
MFLMVLISSSLVLVGCKVKKEVSYEKPQNHTGAFLNQKLKASEFQFNTLSFKSGVKAHVKGKNLSFKASYRIQKDSAIWTTITFLSKPVLTAIITKDSVKYIDRMKKEYFVGEIEYLKRITNIDVNYSMLEQLLVGNTIGFDSTINYATNIDSAFYLISSISKRKIKKALQQGAESKEEYIYRHWLDPKSYRINKQLVNKLSDTTSIEVGYSEYLEVETQFFPSRTDIALNSPTDSGRLELKNSRLKWNIPITFPFKISSKYTKIE